MVREVYDSEGIFLDEDAFFGNRKRRKRRRERRKQRRLQRRSHSKVIARKEKRKAFGRKLGQAYRDIGGASAIGAAIDTLVSPIEKSQEVAPKDFEIGLLQSEEPPKEQEQKSNLIIYALIGGVIVAGIIGVYIYKKKKAVKT